MEEEKGQAGRPDDKVNEVLKLTKIKVKEPKNTSDFCFNPALIPITHPPPPPPGRGGGGLFHGF